MMQLSKRWILKVNFPICCESDRKTKKEFSKDPTYLASFCCYSICSRSFFLQTPVTSQDYYEPDRGIKKDEHKGVWELKAEGRKASFSKTPDSNKKVHNSQPSLPDTIN